MPLDSEERSANASRLPLKFWPPPLLLLEWRQVTPQASLEQQLGQQPALVPGPARQLDLDLLS